MSPFRDRVGVRTVSLRTIVLFCLAKALIVCVIGIVYGSIAVHRLEVPDGIQQFLVDPPSSSRRPSVAYVVTITGCGGSEKDLKRGYGVQQAMALVVQGAGVLSHSVHLAHVTSKYDYTMYAIVHPSAAQCSMGLSALGYTTLIRNTPFDRENINNEYFRSVVDGASCCGAKEYIKLYAYTLVEHEVAVVMDLDSLILKPFDIMFDAMLSSSSLSSEISSTVPIHRGIHHNSARTTNSTSTNDVDGIGAFFTRDYNMIGEGNEEFAGVQGGFLMVRPSERVFQEYIDIVLEGNYIENRGWGGKYGWAFGGAQIQGICAYFYGMIHPKQGVELDRCKVNAMVDSPHFKSGKCRDGRSTCEDCRLTPLEDVMSVHFTLCGKPWECRTSWDIENQHLCSSLHREWFRVRRSFEESRIDNVSLWQLPNLGDGAFQPETYFGYCTGPGGYIPIKV